jgi:hypothetical protein
MDGEKEPYAERDYRCPACGTKGSGYEVTEKSPPAFFLQPHSMYPMSSDEFHQWVTVLRENFPDHPKLRDLGVGWHEWGFRPRTPRTRFLDAVKTRLKFGR